MRTFKKETTESDCITSEKRRQSTQDKPSQRLFFNIEQALVENPVIVPR
jgi:hypothetical protein